MSKLNFNVYYRAGMQSGYVVRINDYTWHIAIFVQENEALDYAAYRNDMLEKYGGAGKLGYVNLPENEV